MQKIKKMIFVILIIVWALSFSIPVLATTDNFDLSGFENKDAGNADTVAENIMGTAINVIRIVGTGVSIIMLSYIGIKYMMSAPNEKAEFKKSMTIYVVGAILVFAATNILSIIENFTSNIATS